MRGSGNLDFLVLLLSGYLRIIHEPPGVSQFSNINIEKLGVAWGQSYATSSSVCMQKGVLCRESVIVWLEVAITQAIFTIRVKHQNAAPGSFHCTKRLSPMKPPLWAEPCVPSFS